ncbi:MAG: zf-HC2 domain-containing protein [Deltaproteobacteria bacterium]|nr:zf-HC2 domain-containing protein [Deltaproteobacteria bacterium]MBW2071217.1 zf-HC2 domain-containing protein [Deltaproteobacteria bacterium]
MECKDCQSRFSDLLDSLVTTEERQALESHLKRCLPCYRKWNSFHKSVSALRGLPSLDPPEHMSAMVAARVANRSYGQKAKLAGYQRWLAFGMSIAALLLISVLGWQARFAIFPGLTEANLDRKALVAEAPLSNTVTMTAPDRNFANTAEGRVVVLQVKDLSKAHAELASLLQSFAAVDIHDSARMLQVRPRAARLIQLRVPSQRYPLLVRELVKIGEVDPRELSPRQLIMQKPQVSLRIVVVTTDK